MRWWRRQREPTAGDLPLLPIDTVLFPGGRLDLRQLEPGLERHLRGLAREGTSLAVSLIETSSVRVHALGTLAAVDEDAGTFRLSGISRLRLSDTELGAGPDRRARAEMVPAAARVAVPEEYASLVFLLGQMAKTSARQPLEAPDAGIDPAEDAEVLGYRLVEVLPVPALAKQKLLELDDPIERLIIVRRYLKQRGLSA
jgi:Lon protease-like protein